jgi:RimJ/RimL family protein N-acetyltransferase
VSSAAFPAPLRTERLILRTWQPGDRESFAELNADPVVMEHFPAPLTHAQSDRFADRIEDWWRVNGWGLWAVQIAEDQSFAGFVGLNRAEFAAPFNPAVEVGWRLAQQHWGRGYATEAARAALGYGFQELDLLEIVSFTSTTNTRSQRVMAKLGMQRDPGDDFDHPGIASGDRLRRHVLYRLTRSDWASRRQGEAGARGASLPRR